MTRMSRQLAPVRDLSFEMTTFGSPGFTAVSYKYSLTRWCGAHSDGNSDNRFVTESSLFSCNQEPAEEEPLFRRVGKDSFDLRHPFGIGEFRKKTGRHGGDAVKFLQSVS